MALNKSATVSTSVFHPLLCWQTRTALDRAHLSRTTITDIYHISLSVITCTQLITCLVNHKSKMTWQDIGQWAVGKQLPMTAKDW